MVPSTGTMSHFRLTLWNISLIPIPHLIQNNLLSCAGPFYTNLAKMFTLDTLDSVRNHLGLLADVTTEQGFQAISTGISMREVAIFSFFHTAGAELAPLLPLPMFQALQLPLLPGGMPHPWVDYHFCQNISSSFDKWGPPGMVNSLELERTHLDFVFRES